MDIFQPSDISAGLKNRYNRNCENMSYPRGATVAKSWFTGSMGIELVTNAIFVFGNSTLHCRGARSMCQPTNWAENGRVGLKIKCSENFKGTASIGYWSEHFFSINSRSSTIEIARVAAPYRWDAGNHLLEPQT